MTTATGNIVLIGFRGVGKSTVSAALSRRLGRPLVSTDKLVSARIGPIGESVRQHGWSRFHEVERQALAGIELQGGVIDSGGGIVLIAANVARLRALGTVVFLRADAATLVERLKNDEERPAIRPGLSLSEEVEQVLAERTPIYRSAADLEIDTQGRLADEVVEEVVSRLEEAERRARRHPSGGR